MAKWLAFAFIAGIAGALLVDGATWLITKVFAGDSND